MSGTLVVVESPAKTRTIGAYLGSDYTVLATMGHLVDLPGSELGVDVDDDFAPKYTVLPGKKKHLTAIVKRAKSSERVVLACDPDREGEAIAYHVARSVPSEIPVARARFNEITKRAVREAIERAGQIDMNLVDAQQARRVMDRLVGYQVSPLLWRTVMPGLSAGRVQSVALRLVCEREDAVEAFKPEAYWEFFAAVETEAGDRFDLHVVPGKGAGAVADAARAMELVVALWSRPFVVSARTVVESKRRPYPPYTTASLQRDSSSRLRFRPSRTMRIAQDLYEGVDLGDGEPMGLITYMRTDSIRVADSARAEAVEFIRANHGDHYLPAGGKGRAFKAQRGAQDAHECVRPTSVVRTPESVRGRLTPEQAKLYELIWRRFVASQMADAVLSTTTIVARSDGVEGRAVHTAVLFDGWQRVMPPSRTEEQRPPLPEVREGTALRVARMAADEKWTSPPSRYTEASLVRALEVEGIGRPSTYAQILDTIAQRKYVVREGSTLIPTTLGRVVNRILVSSFPDVFDVSFTAEYEKRLDEVEEGHARWQSVVRDFYGPFSQDLTAAEKRKPELRAMSVIPTEEKCHLCGRPMAIRFGRYGAFLSCTGYPECKGARPITTGVPCPREGCGGTLVERRSKARGRTFYGCIRWPECDYTVPGPPVEHPCPSCGHPIMYAGRRAGRTLTCPQCKHKAQRSEDEA